MSKREVSKEATEAKKQGVLRSQFIRQHCYAWMRKNEGTKLNAIEDAAWKKYPTGKRAQGVGLDESLLAK
jgi:hypothetical protein